MMYGNDKVKELCEIYNTMVQSVQEEGGQITASVLSDSEKVIVRIRNTGLGVSSEEINRIFERFYKVDKSTHVCPV